MRLDAAVLPATLLIWLAGAAAACQAEVRFGQGVRIGGHDFSGRSYGSVHVQTVRRLPGPEGCRNVRRGRYVRGDGSVVRGPMEVCNLRTIPASRRG